MATTTKRKTKARLTEEHALSYFEAIRRRDLDAMIAHLDNEVIEDITPVGILRGTSEVRDFFTELFAAFPDLEFSVEQCIATAGLASIQWRATGTFRGDPGWDSPRSAKEG